MWRLRPILQQQSWAQSFVASVWEKPLIATMSVRQISSIWLDEVDSSRSNIAEQHRERVVPRAERDAYRQREERAEGKTLERETQREGFKTAFPEKDRSAEFRNVEFGNGSSEVETGRGLSTSNHEAAPLENARSIEQSSFGGQLDEKSSEIPLPHWSSPAYNPSFPSGKAEAKVEDKKSVDCAREAHTSEIPMHSSSSELPGNSAAQLAFQESSNRGIRAQDPKTLEPAFRESGIERIPAQELKLWAARKALIGQNSAERSPKVAPGSVRGNALEGVGGTSQRSGISTPAGK
jgi:hypothetical protein